MGAGILATTPLLAKHSSVQFAGLSSAEKKLLSDYEATIRRSAAIPALEAVRLMEPTKIVAQAKGSLILLNRAGNEVHLQRKCGHTLIRIAHIG